MASKTGVREAGGEATKSSATSVAAVEEGEASESPRQTSQQQEDSIMEYYIEIQSLLMQLTISQVRGDFLHGEIIDIEDPDMTLFGLDKMRSLFTPRYSPNQLNRRITLGIVVEHVTALMNGGKDMFFIPSGQIMLEPHSYFYWKDLLKELMASTYWLSIATSPRQEVKMVLMDNVVEECLDEKVSPREHQDYTEKEGVLSKHKKKCLFPKKESVGFRQSSPKYRKSKKRRDSVSSNDSVDTPVEEIIIESSDSSDDCEQSISTDFSYGKGKYKEVVTPPCFDSSESTQSMRQYLELFERYFHAKYKGGQHECSMELSKFLTGDALAAYNKFGGPVKRYSIIKERLLDWFRTYQVQGAKRWKRDLRNLIMEPGTSFKLFGLQVQELAEKAYPQDNVECARRMQERFTKATPGWFNERLRQRQDMKEMMGLGHKLTWSDMLKQAEREDKQLRDKKWKKSEIKQEETAECGVWHTQMAEGDKWQKERPQYQQKVYTNMKYSGQRQHSPRRDYADVMCCFWCGRPGHIARNCIRRKSCFICGRIGHFRRDCPAYNKQSTSANYQENGMGNISGTSYGRNDQENKKWHFNPKCPRCGGPHIGIDCTSHSQEPLN